MVSPLYSFLMICQRTPPPEPPPEKPPPPPIDDEPPLPELREFTARCTEWVLCNAAAVNTGNTVWSVILRVISFICKYS